MSTRTHRLSWRSLFVGTVLSFVAFGLHGCVSVRTIPTIARAGDTVSAMVGGSEEARPETTIALLINSSTSQQWDLQALGLIRSVFNVRADGRANGLHYGSWVGRSYPWDRGHEPIQTVLVVDLPTDCPPGDYGLLVNTNTPDDSSGGLPAVVDLEIISGVGTPDPFDRKDITGPQAAALEDMEPAPYAKVDFGTSSDLVGAAHLEIDFDETVVNPDDINVYVPESTVRGTPVTPGAFGATQRMAYWHQNGQKLFLDMVAPQGIEARFLMAYLIHPRGLTGSPAFNLDAVNSVVYDTDGTVIGAPAPALTYFP